MSSLKGDFYSDFASNVSRYLNLFACVWLLGLLGGDNSSFSSCGTIINITI